eukprot:TRINITY_DN1388_c2_g1_i2.p1 TRINITY_DN1388_c2_g1~~TRINITY_DN1388_c2_g1_i2.p1  ORF type:complete len:463 (+),score=75.02 TRINITY_DN1388_c2_g1_i2:94-1482(+)
MASLAMNPKPVSQKKEVAEESPADRGDTVVMFNMSKSEVYDPGRGYKAMNRLLKKNWTIKTSRDLLSEERMEGVSLLILPGSRERFDESEIDVLKKHLEKGGSILILTGEGGEKGPWATLKDGNQCNLKRVIDVLSQNTITVNNDYVVRTVHYKYYHPKEAHIGDGICNREVNKCAKNLSSDKGAQSRKKTQSSLVNNDQLSFVYPHGGTLSLQKPAVPLLTSGYIAYPLNRPICAVYEWAQKQGKRPGRLMVCASLQMLEDKWINEEENSRLAEVLMRWLLWHPSIKLNQIDAEEPEIADYLHLPDVESLAERLRVCLESPDELPRDATTMFDLTTFKFDTDLIPESVKAYEQTNVKHEPLTLIQPEFHTPLPPFYPATVPPIHREPPHPALDLFDLDEHFASERQRLAILTNKCNDGQSLEYYITAAADIMGLTKKLAPSGEEVCQSICVAKVVAHSNKN